MLNAFSYSLKSILSLIFLLLVFNPFTSNNAFAGCAGWDSACISARNAGIDAHTIDGTTVYNLPANQGSSSIPETQTSSDPSTAVTTSNQSPSTTTNTTATATSSAGGQTDVAASTDTTGAAPISAVNSSNIGTTGQNGSTATDTSAVPADDAEGVDRAVYDNAIRDGRTPAEASALAGGYTPPAGAAPDTSTNNVLGIPNNQLRTGTVDMDTIPRVLVSIINVLLGVAGTISIVALIYYAIQMQINSGITGDSSGVDNAKKGMKGAILGFIVAILAWFIVIRFIEILSSLS